MSISVLDLKVYLSTIDVGIIVSALGLIVTLVTLETVGKINKTFLRRKRLPKLLKSLGQRMTDLNDYLLAGDISLDSVQTLDILGKIRADLDSIYKKSKEGEVKTVIKMVKNLEKKKDKSKYSLEDLYGKLSGVFGLTENLVKDEKWKVK